ncbi:hypothetical protein L3X38_036154 [Prunus dulcis]|uniref:CCHC-type domain-containing protein n=1 Tax=Prunus dulcis TaxID=3755 RepID=A0AAD4YNB3_PRUDU|nr:hypothetical protein L3X38_036154 [Prunus dulcis]
MGHLIVRLRIEEDNRGSEKKSGGSSMVAKAHVVKDGPKNRKKRKHSGEGSSQGNSKKNKGFKGKGFNCNKHGHRAANCQSKGKTMEVHMTKEEKNQLARMLRNIVREVVLTNCYFRPT